MDAVYMDAVYMDAVYMDAVYVWTQYTFVCKYTYGRSIPLFVTTMHIYISTLRVMPPDGRSIHAVMGMASKTVIASGRCEHCTTWMLNTDSSTRRVSGARVGRYSRGFRL